MSGNSANIHVGAFGKHPAWDDHMEDLGLTTQAMVDFKRVLYVEGIAACVDNGSWDKLDPGQSLDGYSHAILYRLGAGESIIAMLWSSTDGKGRDKYPMVGCVQVSGWDLESAAEVCVRALAGLRARCETARTPDDVRAAVKRAHSECAMSAPAREQAELTIDGAIAGRLAARPEFGSGSGQTGIGFARLLYQMDLELASYIRSTTKGSLSMSGLAGSGLAGLGNSRTRTGVLGPRHLRVPACFGARAGVGVGGRMGEASEGAAGVMSMWLKFMYLKIDPGCPAMIIAPIGREWLDVLVGSPIGAQMFCIRAGTQSIPVVTEVPYSLDEGMAARVSAFLGDCAARPAEQLGVRSSKLSVGANSGAKGGGNGVAGLSGWKLVVVVLVLLGLLAGSVAFLLGAAPVHASEATTLDDPLEQQRVVENSDSINAAWRRQVEFLKAGYAGSGTAVQLRAEKLRDMLVDLGSKLPKGVIAPSAQTASWGGAFAAQVRREGERTIERALTGWQSKPIDPADAAAGDGPTRALREVTELYSRADRLGADMVRAESLLAEGFALNESPQAGDAIAAITGRWANDGLAVDRGVRASLSPVLDRADALAVIERQMDTAPLVAAARSPGAGPELVLAAWRRLAGRSGVFWPVSRDELDIELDIGTRVRAAIGTLSPARQQALMSEVKQEQARRLTRYVGGAEGADGFAAGMDALERLGVDGASLEPRVRFNAMVRDLKRRVRNPALPEADVIAECRRFVDAVRALPGGVAFLSESAATVKTVEQALKGELSAEPAEADLAGLGPAATGDYTGKRIGDRLVFEPKGGGPALEFIAIPGSAAEGRPAEAFCIGTTEVSVEMFDSIHLTRRHPFKLTAILPEFEADDDARLGPRAWMWDSRRNRVEPSPDWLTKVTATSADQYPPGSVPPRPSAKTPMQHLSPAAAAATAVLAGCRLPSAGEWTAAAAKLGAHGAGANLRDQAWERQRAYVEACITQRRVVQTADAGAFAGTEPEHRTSRPEDDGVLWLAPVGSGGTAGASHHLIGNVWEYVFEATPDQWNSASASPVEPATISAWIAARPERLGVVGGSALSSPALGVDKRHPVRLADSADGFSDVGFRLAFSAPAALAEGDQASLGARLDQALTPTPFLKPR